MIQNRLSGKAAIITGCASGIGRASALRLAREGADLVGLDLDAEGLKSLKAEIQEIGRTCEVICGSVATLENVDAAVKLAADALGGLDFLVNNAGIGGPIKRFDRADADEFDKIVSINLKPVWHGIKAAYAPMKARGGGAIVNVASMAGLRPSKHLSLYGMTKAGVVSLTQHAAMEYAAANIRVNCLCPGPVDTPIFEQIRDTLDDAAYQSARRLAERRTVMKRYGTAEEQAAAVAYLLSDDASFVTGIAMPVDGGWLISDGQPA